MKKFRNLDKTWKEILYSASGFGPNLLMVLMGAFFTDAVNPTALGLEANPAKAVQAISGVCLITPALFSILWFIGKVFDGLIDIPFAHVTDNLKTKWGRRRLPILICFIPMVVSYALCWIPISQNTTVNTLWIFLWALIFFATYTMNLIAFYGSLSTVCADEAQRLRVSSFKSFFDTITYCLVYALVPLILGGLNIHIDKLVFLLLPTMITMIIPIFMIKEGDKWEAKAIAEGYDIRPLKEEENVGIIESLKLTFTNKPFMKWCLVNCCSFFGLQMFLVSMNALILGGMGMNSTQMAILNTCAFAPVPIMLYVFNKIKNKKGIRFAYQACLLCFAICILSFTFGSNLVCGDNMTLKIIIGSIGGVVGSFGIGAFFMMPYMVPAQISSVEEKLTGKNHSAMYFAAQAVTTSIVGAVSSSLIYENIKCLFFEKGTMHIVKAVDTEDAAALTLAAEKLGCDASNVYNLGTFLVPIIVSLFCVLGFILAFRMPKEYDPETVAKELNLEKEYKENIDQFQEKKKCNLDNEALVVMNGLWVLSGSLFGYIWFALLNKGTNTFAKKKRKTWAVVLLNFMAPFLVMNTIMLNNEINHKLDELNIKHKKSFFLVAITSLFGLTCISNSVLQAKINRIANVVNE